MKFLVSLNERIKNCKKLGIKLGTYSIPQLTKYEVDKENCNLLYKTVHIVCFQFQ